MAGSNRQNKMFKKSNRGYVQKGNPNKVTSCGRRRPYMQSKKQIA